MRHFLLSDPGVAQCILESHFLCLGKRPCLPMNVGHEPLMNNCGDRYYDPARARFLTRGPIGYAGGVNLYAYCQNNPVNFVDPMGLCGEGGNMDNPYALPGSSGLPTYENLLSLTCLSSGIPGISPSADELDLNRIEGSTHPGTPPGPPNPEGYIDFSFGCGIPTPYGTIDPIGGYILQLDNLCVRPYAGLAAQSRGPSAGLMFSVSPNPQPGWTWTVGAGYRLGGSASRTDDGSWSWEAGLSSRSYWFGRVKTW